MNFKRYSFKSTNTRDCHDVIARSRWEAWDVINNLKTTNPSLYWDVEGWELIAIYSNVWHRDLIVWYSQTALLYAAVIKKMTGKFLFDPKWGEGKPVKPVWEAGSPSRQSQDGQLELFNIKNYEDIPDRVNPYQ